MREARRTSRIGERSCGHRACVARMPAGGGDERIERGRERGQDGLDRLVVLQREHAHTWPALADAARAAGFPHVTAEPEPFIALSRARERAGDGGAVLVTGSLYLLERLRAAALEAR